MSFKQRTQTADTFIEILFNNYWVQLKDCFNLIHETYGYETHISSDMQEYLKKDYSTTGKFIRFTPDFILSRKFPNLQIKTILLEYKVTKTPRYSLGKNQWYIGQIEANAWDNYMNLINVEVQIAILIYCPYHPRPILCDYPNLQWLVSGRQRTSNSRGSGTDFVNIDLCKLRTLDEFMKDEFDIPICITESLLDKSFFQLLIANPLLRTDHHFKSKYKNDANYETGFNWTNRYL